MFNRRAQRPTSVRRRMLAMMLSFMVAGLVLAGAVGFALPYGDLNRRVDAELQQRADEFRNVAAAKGNTTRTPYPDLTALFRTYFSRVVPSEHEAMMAVVDGKVVLVSGGERPFDLNAPAVLQAIGTHRIPGASVITEASTETATLRLLISDVRLTGAPDSSGVLVVGNDVGRQRARIWSSLIRYGLVAAVTILLAGLVGNLIARRLLRPLTELRAATSEISSVDLTRRVAVSSEDTDVAEVGRAFNAMLDRLETGFAEQRQFLDDAAHELRTPLTIVRGHVELLDIDDADDIRATRELVLEESDRMARLVDDLLLLANSQRPDFVLLREVAVAELGKELLDRGVVLADRDWQSDFEQSGTIHLDRQRVSQAAIQLMANAVKFSAPGDRITIATRWADAVPQSAVGTAETATRYLAISVADSGVGIAEAEQQRLFQRFFRSPGASRIEGSGLGLPLVAAIMEAHGGAISVLSTLGVGSTFTLWLPDVSGAEETRLGNQPGSTEQDRDGMAR